jgi:chromosome segregation ATPase
VPVKAGEKKTFSVVLEHQGWQSLAVGNITTAQLVAYAGDGSKLDDKARKAFARLADVRRKMDSIDQETRELSRQRDVIFQDQQRVRENLRTLTGTSDVQQRYLRKLNEQEDQIAKIDAARDDLAKQRRTHEETLNKMIAELEF